MKRLPWSAPTLQKNETSAKSSSNVTLDFSFRVLIVCIVRISSLCRDSVQGWKTPKNVAVEIASQSYFSGVVFILPEVTQSVAKLYLGSTCFKFTKEEKSHVVQNALAT